MIRLQHFRAAEKPYRESIPSTSFRPGEPPQIMDQPSSPPCPLLPHHPTLHRPVLCLLEAHRSHQTPHQIPSDGYAFRISASP
jgi:hypothetical protein